MNYFLRISIGFCFVSASVFAQSAAPANAWLRTATSYPLQADSVSQSSRSVRDQYFDAVFGNPSPLKPETASWAHIGQDPSAAKDIAKFPELPTNPNRTIVSATFTKFQSVLSQSQRSIYTEISFTLDHSFEAPNDPLAAGTTITVAIAGGSVQTSGGNLSYLVDPQDFFIQPGKRYLLVLSYNADGDFYTLVKNWELSGGVVTPNSKLEQTRAAQGKAALASVAEDQIAPVLQRFSTVSR